MLRLGLVDFDSSHAVEFTRRFNHVGVDADQYVAGARVVLGWPGNSEMAPERIPGFRKAVEACGVEIVSHPAEMLGRIDGVLILSLSGAVHLQRARPFLEAGLPVYVDKPFACSLTDAEEMIRLAGRHGGLLYHSSALPFSEEVLRFQQQRTVLGEVRGAVSYGPAKRAAGNPGLFHYGIHAVSVLFSVMGTGCHTVRELHTPAADVVCAEWDNQRVATLRGNREGATAYGFLAFCEKGVVHQTVSTRYAYRNLCRSIVAAFTSGELPVSHQRVLQEVRFVLAALQSEQQNGAVVSLRDLSASPSLPESTAD